MLFLAIFAFALGALAIGFGIWSYVLPRVRSAERLKEIQSYGFSAQKSLSGLPVIDTDLKFLPSLAKYLGDLLAKFGGVKEERLRTELRSAGYYTTSARVFNGYRVLAAGLFGALALWAHLRPSMLQSVLFAIGFAWLGWIFPLVSLRRRARSRLAEIDRSLPDLVDLLVVTVEAGLSFASSLQVASARLEGPFGEELRLTLQEQQMGTSLNVALEHMSKRAPTPAMQSFVRSVIQGESLGVSIGTIMRNLADEMRVRRRQNAEERAQKAPTKMLFPLVFMIFPAMGIILLGPAMFEISKALGS
jgi:tight adherence protein C